MIDMADIQDVCNQIVEKFQPEQVILFGSYAYGEPTKDSDVDLLVILPFEGEPIDKTLEIMLQLKRDFPMDLMVKTPEEARSAYEQYCPFTRWALNYGKVLYGRNTEKLAS